MPAPSPPTFLDEPLTLTFQPGGDPQISAKMEAWTQRLVGESGGRISCVNTAFEDNGPIPSLTLPGAGDSRISYHFVPEGPEETAFLELLRRRIETGPSRGASIPETGSLPTEPEQLLLFVANECPNCPRAVRVVHTLATDPAAPPLHVHVFEATLSPELVDRHQVKSVPTLLLRDTFRFVGSVDRSEILGILFSIRSGGMFEEQIRHLIRWGEAPEAGKRIADMPEPGFLIRDLEKSTFQERVGLLLAFEEALANRPGCLDPLVPGIVGVMDRAEPALRGDLADLLGKIGCPDALPALERVRQDPNPDVAEAAEDAVAQILERSR